MKPTIGRIVIYNLPVNSNLSNNGSVEAPAVVVQIFDDGKINLRVLLDGPDIAWATSVLEGNGAGCWHWPPRA